ncbi:MAG: site-specific integrase [bacterium]|nr:site-specific integrase [bacterium]
MDDITTPISTDSLTVSLRLDHLASRFLADQDVSASSRGTYGKGLQRFLEHARALGQFAPAREEVLAYKRSLEAEGLSALTISNYLVAVRKFFEWLEASKIYPNVARGIKGSKRVKGFRKDCLTIGQVCDLFQSLDRSDLSGKRDYALLNLLVTTGLRTVEVTRADIGDIRQEGGEAVLWIQGKGHAAKDDFVLVPFETLRPIREYLSARGALRTMNHSSRL